jgi:hypothetical protein
MSREWKPGDVAFFDLNGTPVLMMRDNEGRWTGYDGTGRYGWASRPYDGRHGQRAAAVIDPEDREQVKEIVRLSALPIAWTALRDALREFASPTPPKPDEPQGLGAVVRDDEGDLWQRDYRGGNYPWNRLTDEAGDSNKSHRDAYKHIPAVAVLFEGVTEDAS